jgi:hypothetical protein
MICVMCTKRHIYLLFLLLLLPRDDRELAINHKCEVEIYFFYNLIFHTRNTHTAIAALKKCRGKILLNLLLAAKVKYIFQI